MKTSAYRRSRLSGLAFVAMTAVVSTLSAGVNTWSGTLSAESSTPGPGLVAADPRDPYVVYAVSQPNLYKSRDGGRSWTRLASFVHIDSLLIHPAAPDTLYAGVVDGPNADFAGVVKSSDGGLTWVRKPFEPNALFFGPVGAIAGSPTDAATVFASAYGSFFQSTNGGDSWTGGGGLSGFIASLVVAPSDPQVIYSGTEYDTYYYPFGAFARSTDGGLTWTRPDLGRLDSVSTVAVDPTEPSKVYVGLSANRTDSERGIRRSEDGGVTFSRADSGLQLDANVSSLVVDPANPSTLYAGTDSGVYRSRDSGSSWLAMGQILSGTPVDSIAISADGRSLHAASRFGAFDFDIATGPIDIAQGDGGSRILRWEADRLSVQTLDRFGGWTVTPTEGPSSTWTAVAVAGAADGLARVLWQNSDGRSSLEIVGGAGRISSVVFERGDAIPTDVSVGPTGEARLLWTDAYGGMSLAGVDADGVLSFGPRYGATPTWAAVALADASDGDTWVLWRCADGRFAVSIHEDGVLTAAFRFPATPDFTVEDIAVASDGRPRILATSVGGAMQIWTVNKDGFKILGSTYESPGLFPRRIAAGADAPTRVLWSDGAGHGSVWLIGNDGTHVSTDDVPVP